MIIGPAPSFARVHRMFGVMNFLAVSYEMNAIAISNDARAWFTVDWPLPAGYVITETPFFCDGRFWIPCRRPAGGSGFVGTEDGRMWVFVQVTPSNVSDRFVYAMWKLNHGVWVAHGFGDGVHLWSSSDLAAWEGRNDPVSGSNFLFSGATDGSIIVLRSAFGPFATTSDGAAFVSRASGLPSGTPQFLKHLNGRFIAGGGVGATMVAASEDGAAWAPHEVGLSSGSPRGVSFSAGRYTIPGSAGGLIRHSVDLSTWANSNVPESYDSGAIGIASLGERVVVASSDLDTQLIVSGDGGQNFSEMAARLPFARARYFVGRD